MTRAEWTENHAQLIYEAKQRTTALATSNFAIISQNFNLAKQRKKSLSTLYLIFLSTAWALNIEKEHITR